MVTTKFYVGILFVILTVGSLYLNSTIIDESNSSLNHSADFPEWRPDNNTLASVGCSCHSDTTVQAAGSIDVVGQTTVESLTYFDLQFKTSGFTVAGTHQILMGFNTLDDDNSLFTKNITVYNSSIPVDATGTSNNVNFTFKSPLQGGSYSLHMYAIYSTSGQNLNYLSKVIPITVNQVSDTIKPVINSLTVNDKPYSSNMVINGQVNLKADVTDAHMSEVDISTNGVDFTKMAYDSSSQNYLYSFSTNSFTGNSLTVTIAAFDKGGNNATQIYDFSLNTTPGALPDADILSFKITQSININDGKIDPLWDDISGTPVSEFGTNGLIKTADDGVYLYTLLEYDASYKWIAIEFDAPSSTDCMNTGHDGWVFGTDATGNVEYHGDYHFIGTSGAPILDARNDVFFESFTTNGITYIETARLFNTNDTAGNDFNFTLNDKFSVIFASSQYHTSTHTPMSWIVTDIAPAGATTNTSPVEGVKNALDLQAISDAVFVVSFVIVLVTVFIHISLRVVSKPIKHEKRIIYTDKIPNQPSSITLIKNFFSKRKHKTMEEKK